MDVGGLGDLLADREAAQNIAAHVVEGGTTSRENPAARPLAVGQQPEEEVLGFDGVRPESADLGANVQENHERL